MFRFSIRDLLWVTVAVALGVGWRVDKQGWTNERAELIRGYRLMDHRAEGLEKEMGKMGLKVSWAKGSLPILEGTSEPDGLWVPPNSSAPAPETPKD